MCLFFPHPGNYVGKTEIWDEEGEEEEEEEVEEEEVVEEEEGVM